MNNKVLASAIPFIDSWLDFNYKQGEIPGFIVAVSHQGNIIFNKAYGFANLESKTKLTTDHIFRIASHSKSFTATAILQLVEKGKIRLDDYIIDYLPWLNRHRDKRFQKVTIRQLLSHSAGIIRDGLDADYWQLDRPFPDEKHLKQEILEADLVLDTNIQMKYSNFGYSLLGMVIESVSGETYNEFVNKNIIIKLGLKNTGPEYEKSIKNKLATAYTRRDNNKIRRPLPNIDTKAMSAATGFYSTSRDLCSYFTAQFVGSNKLLNDESKKEMQRTQWHVKGSSFDEDYGFGLEIENIDGTLLIGHGGGFPGHITKTLFDPKTKIVVTVLTNCIDSEASWMARGIFTVLDYFRKNQSSRQSKIDKFKFQGRYLNLWSITDIVVAGNKIVAVYPGSWKPFEHPEELEYIDGQTLKIAKTDSFLSEGELVKFKFDKQGRILSVIYAGGTMLPETDYLKLEKSKY